MTTNAIVETYTDVMGREQVRVAGPNGTWLVTANQRTGGRSFEVWKSDSVAKALYAKTRESGIRQATYLATR